MSPAPWNNDPLPPHLIQDTMHTSTNETATPTIQGSKVNRRNYAISHPPVDAPICVECQALDLTFFDPSCQGCRDQLTSSRSDIGHVFAVMRQWVPQVQQKIEFLIWECLRRGAHPDDRDSLSDMTLLMYACKAGANGVGDASASAKVAQELIDLGADLTLRCKWTHMSALHYAAYFDVAPVLQKLLQKSKGSDVDTTCQEYENGTALHIASANLSLQAAKVLLAFGADKNLKDDLARIPVDCLPDPEEFSTIPETEEVIEQLEKLLSIDADAKEKDSMAENGNKKASVAVSGRTALKALGLKVGDRVLAPGQKLGTLRFCGMTDFAMGIWAGIELDEPDGKNNGSVKGITYFTCNDNHGIFVQANKISKVGREYREEVKATPRQNVVNHGKVDTRHVASRLNDQLILIEEKSEIRVGDRVQVNQIHEGTVRFIGEVDFVAGNERWFGIELDYPFGQHDGTIQGVRYFAAAPNCGIFVTEAKLIKIVDSSQVLQNKDGRQSSASKTSAPVRRRNSFTAKYNASRPPSAMNSCESQKSFTSTMGRTGGSISGKMANRQQQIGKNLDEAKEDGWKTVSLSQESKFKKKMPKKYLEPGTSVICIHNKEMAVVKYVGRVTFASGIWVGLEMRNPVGKHDGIVQGKRYFTCKANHGVIMKPSKISVHGINGQNLLKPESEYPL